MTTSAFPVKAEIIASTSDDVFPVQTAILLERIESNKPLARFLVKRPNQPLEELFRKDLPAPGGSLQGEFRRNGQDLVVVITLCRGKESTEEPRYTCGLLFKGGRIEGGALGVWVAEERPGGRPL